MPTATGPAPRGLTDPSLSFNASAVLDYNAAMQFVDLMRNARAAQTWIQEEGGGVRLKGRADFETRGLVDDEGWVIGIPPTAEKYHYHFAWRTDDEGLAAARAGRYVLEYEGEGEIRITGRVGVVEEEPGRMVLDLPGGRPFSIQVLDSDPDDYIRDISLVREDQYDLWQAGALFNPEWIASIEDVRELRFMTWMGANAKVNPVPVREWEDRNTLDTATWSQGGVPLEAMVRLANEIGADPWFTIPYGATDAYVRNFAAYVRDNLDPALVASVELSNEMWNWSYGQTQQLLDEAEATWGREGQIQWNWHAKQATEHALVWDEVFGAEADARLRHVLGSQAVSEARTEAMLEAPKWRQYEPDQWVRPADVFDAVAVASYFGSRVFNDDAYVADLAAALETSPEAASDMLFERLSGTEVPRTLEALAEQAEVVERFGVDLVLYEGGQHVLSGSRVGEGSAMFEFLVDFIRGEEMADLYTQLWDGWEQVGTGPFMQFLESGEPSKFGSWGLLHHLGDTTPNAERVYARNAETPAWWEDRGGVHFQHGVTRTGTEAGESMRGTLQEDFLVGGGGDDNLAGFGSNDGLNGGAGDDTLRGQDGADTLFGGAGDDRMIGAGDGDRLDGGAGADVMHGGTGADVLDGGGGDDLIMGGAQWDTIRAGAGDDVVQGGKGGDRIDLGAGADLFRDSPQRGPNGGDDVAGGSGPDTLQGAGGADTLAGGDGDDLLTGGLDGDRFVFAGGPAAGVDTVADFTPGTDVLALEAAGFAGLAPGAVALDTGGGDATGPAVLYAEGVLSFLPEGGEASPFAVLDGAPALTAADFLVL